MKKKLLIIAASLFSLATHSQTAKEKAKQYVDNLVTTNNQPFAYTKGSFAVSDNGAMNYEVPLVCVQGASGMTPRLSFVYNSNNGSGILGEGWSLSGLSVITRTNQNYAIDGKNGRIEFSDNDRLLLDGQRLINTDSTSTTYWANSLTNSISYFTEQQSFRQITSYYTNNKVVRFEVRTKDGLTYHYGAIGDQQTNIENGYYLKSLANGGIISWLLVRIEDLNQNVIDFEYDKIALAKSFIKPTLVKYTGRKETADAYFAWVQFNYGKVGSRYKYINGQQIQFDEILHSVICEFKDATGAAKGAIRTYKIGYDSLPEQNKYFIKNIRECIDNNDCLATEFKWQTPYEKALLDKAAKKYSTGKTITEDYQSYTGDFNGDGLLDNACVKVNADKISLLVSRNTNGSFEQAKEFNLPAAIDPDCRIMINDFDANGTSDFAFCWIKDNKFSFQVAYSPAMLNGKDILSPVLGKTETAALESGIKKNEVFYSTNDFDGDGLQDIYCYYYKNQSVKLLFAINNASKDFALKPVKTLQTIFVNGTDKDTIPQNLPINLGDYNSDGITDLLATWIDTKGWKTKVFLLNSNLVPQDRSSKIINGEKRKSDSLSITRIGSKQIQTIVDTIPVALDSLIVKTSPYKIYKNENLPVTKAVYTLDINHDGNSDLLVSNQNNKGWKTWTILGKGNGDFEEPGPCSIDTVNYRYSPAQSFGDFNGDGQVDICITYTNEKGWFAKITYGNGNGLFSRFPETLQLDSSRFSYSVKQSIKGMMNQEAFVKSLPEVSAERLKKIFKRVVPNTLVNNLDETSAFFADTMWRNQVIPTSSFGKNSEEYFSNYTFTDKPKDFGENITNIKRIRSISVCPESAKINISRNKLHSVNGEGDPLCYAETENKSVNESAAVTFIDFWKPVIADLNGDGITDFALTYPRQPESNVGSSANELNGEWKTIVSLNQAGKTGKINKIVLGNGADIQVEYASTTKAGGFDCDTLPLSYPNIPYNIPLSIVKSTISPDGIGGVNRVNYEYKNAIIGITGRGFVGFEKTTIHSAINGYKIYKSFRIDSAFLHYGMLPLAATETKVNSVLINSERYTNAIYRDCKGRVVYNYIAGKSSSSYDLTGALLNTSQSDYEYDQFGNLVKSQTTWPDGQVDMISNEYVETSPDENDQVIKRDNLSRWIIGRLKSATIHKSKGSESQVIRKSEFEYYPATGQLKLEKTLVGTNYEINKNYYYDKRGNRIKEESFPLLSPAELVTTLYEYTDHHRRFLTKRTDALNYSVSYKPHDIYGFNQETTDADGNTSKLDFPINYDPLGRKKKILYADGTSSTENNYKCSSCGVVNAVYFKLSSSSAVTTPVITFYDIFDRPLKTISFDINYNRIAKDEVYNAKGELVSSSTPYFDGRIPSAPVYFSSIGRDDLGRNTKITNPDGTKNRVEYQGLKTTVINNKGQRSITINDLFGRKKTEIDNLGDSVNYRYDLDGNLAEITDQTGRKFISEFDPTLGKIRSSYNPNNAQTTAYAYNYWGELEEVKHGYSGTNVTVFTYDRIGRVKSRTEKRNRLSGINAPDNKTEDTIEYEYVQFNDAVPGKGKLKATKVTGDDRKLDKSFEYDKFGRLVKKSFGFENFIAGSAADAEAKAAWNTAIGNGKTIDISYSYTAQGQLESIKYPKLGKTTYAKDFVVKYSYENGSAKTVQANAKKIWEYTEGNADGTTRTISLNDNKTISTYKYNELNQNLEGIATIYNGSTKIQNWSYTYDSLNNVIERVDVDNSPTFGERYTYDELNRIKTVTNNGTLTNYQYDRLGNIKYRGDVGYYREKSQYLPTEVKGEKKLIVNKDSIVKNDEGWATDKDYLEYYYDLVGNRYKKEINENVQFRVDYNHFNKPHSISNAITGSETTFYYDEENKLQVEKKGTAVNYFIDGLFEFEFTAESRVNQKFFIPVNGEFVAYNNIENNATADKFFFLHKDALGSVTAITDEKGKAVVYAYDIWGKRLDPKTWKPVANGFTKGFTGHQNWDDLGLINMGGRIYDPLTAQFLQVDPVLNMELPTLGLTAYSYCYNNPLYYTDPSGYWSLGKFLGGAARGVVRALVAGPTATLLVFPAYRDFIDKNAGTIVTVQGIVASAILTPLGVPPAVTGFATGFASSFAQVYLNGGTFGQAFEAGMISGTISGVTAGITAGIGDAFVGPAGSSGAGLFGDNEVANYTGKALAQAAFQGAVNESQGGSFKDGALPSLISSGGDAVIGQVGGSDISSRVGRTAIAATVGGTASSVGGGKFANGAATAATAHIFGYEAHYVDPAAGAGRSPAGSKDMKWCYDEKESLCCEGSIGNFNLTANGKGQLEVGYSAYDVVGGGVSYNVNTGTRTYSAGVGIGANVTGNAFVDQMFPSANVGGYKSYGADNSYGIKANGSIGFGIRGSCTWDMTK